MGRKEKGQAFAWPCWAGAGPCAQLIGSHRKRRRSAYITGSCPDLNHPCGAVAVLPGLAAQWEPGLPGAAVGELEHAPATDLLPFGGDGLPAGPGSPGHFLFGAGSPHA